MAENLLSILKPGVTVSGEVLARKLKITRQGLHKQILSLRGRGIQIVGKPKTGYKLTREADLLSLGKIQEGIRTKCIGTNLVLLEKTSSTQVLAKDLAESGSPEGTGVIAEEQSRGRGRMGRAWISGRGGLWVSVILRPRMAPQIVPLLALSSSVAIARAIESVCGIACRLKWPNDILVGGGKGKPRKVCGTLIEMSAESDRVRWAVLGFGIDVNNPTPASLKSIAVSLKEATGKAVDRNLLLRAVLEELDRAYRIILSQGFVPLKKDYMRRSILKRGTRLKLSDFNRSVRGRLVEFAADGSLVLSLDGKRQERFYAGDVTIGS